MAINDIALARMIGKSLMVRPYISQIRIPVVIKAYIPREISLVCSR